MAENATRNDQGDGRADVGCRHGRARVPGDVEAVEIAPGQRNLVDGPAPAPRSAVRIALDVGVVSASGRDKVDTRAVIGEARETAVLGGRADGEHMGTPSRIGDRAAS